MFKIITSLFFLLIFTLQTVNGQKINKKSIDSAAYRNWEEIHEHAISNDGKYIAYSHGPINNIDLLTIVSTDKRFLMNVPWGHQSIFSDDSKICLYKLPGDSLAIYNLKSGFVRYLEKVDTYKIVGRSDNQFIWVTMRNRDNMLIRLKNNMTFEMGSGELHLPTMNKSYLFFRNEDSIFRFNLDYSRNETLLKVAGLTNFCVDASGQFICYNSNQDSIASIYNYSIKDRTAVKLVSDNETTLGLKICFENLAFSKNSKSLYFDVVTSNKFNKSRLDIASVDIWNYKDNYLQSSQLLGEGQPFDKFKGVVNLTTRKWNILESSKERLRNFNENNDYLLLGTVEMPEDYYKPDLYQKISLVSTKDFSKRVVINRTCRSFGNYSPKLSDNERYLIWYDVDKRKLFSYSAITTKIASLLDVINFPVFDDEAEKLGRDGLFGIADWIKQSGNDYIVVYDRYDIWRIDLSRKTSPICITKGYGRKNQIIFSMIPGLSDQLVRNKSLIISGYSYKNKANGFWELDLKHNINPILTVMSQHNYYIPRHPRLGLGFVEYSSELVPVKAKKANVFIVPRMSATESINLFLTSDFRNFKKITKIEPEKDVNWLTTQLISWKTPLGNTLQGILYFPENFDSSKKYPVLVTYYEKRSNELNRYLKPDYSRHRIDIPTFVSNGYIVFVPDIEFVQRDNGSGTLLSIVSAMDRLSSIKGIDLNNIGLHGHSFGGWETNYLITHTNIFRAACEASGASNLVSGFGDLIGTNGNGSSRAKFYETMSQGSPYGIGITPWSHAEVYIKNSPIFNINDVTTPLLIMHNKNDSSVPFMQGVSLFTGLRRAGKKVWLLQYDGEGHTLDTDLAAKDYSIRIMQFFNHYLRQEPAPIWMTQGIPAYRKGYETGYNLDNSEQP